MKDVIVTLEKKKRSLLSRIFGLKEQVEKETDERTHKVEIESLETEVKSVEDQIFDTMIEEAKTKVSELEAEAVKLVDEKKSLQARVEQIDIRLIQIFTACSVIIPKQRRQISSKKSVVMQKTVEEREFTGYFERAVDARENRLPYTTTKRTVEVLVPAFPDQISHAESLGYHLKEENEKAEPEELNSENSVETFVFPMPSVLSENIF